MQSDTISDEELEKRLYLSTNYHLWSIDCRYKYFSNRKLTLQTLVKGMILPPIQKNNGNPRGYSGGVCDENCNFVEGFCTTRVKDYLEIRDAYICDEVEYIDKDVIYGGLLRPHFGHFILENLGRMYYVLNNQHADKEIVFIMLPHNDECGWMYKIFELMDISKERIKIIRKPTQFKSIIIPEDSVHIGYQNIKEFYYTAEYPKIYKYMSKKAVPSEHKKIYLTRSKLENINNPCLNEQYFEKYFAKHGYKIVAPEKLSIEEQISLISGADEIAAIMGTLTHWALFCKPGTKFTILTRNNNGTLLAQCLVNEATKVDWYFVDVSLNFLYSSHIFGAKLIGPTTQWRRFIKEHFNDSGMVDESWKNLCFEYIFKWCQRYFDPTVKALDRGFNQIRTLDILDFLGNMYTVMKQFGLPYDINQYFEADFEKLSKIYDINSIVIFGAGNTGQNVLFVIKQTKQGNMNIMFCDNDRSKWDKPFRVSLGGGVL